MILVAISFFVIATFDVSLGFYHNVKAFVFVTGDGAATGEFSDISDWVNISRTVTVLIQTTIGDGMLIYRCWIVWSRSWRVVAVSIVIWLGGLVTTIATIYFESTLHSKALVNASKLSPWITSFWAVTIVLNIITTSLLVWRIWAIDRQNNNYRFRNSRASQSRSGLRNVMRSVIESGLLYTVTAFITFVTYITNSIAVYPVSDAEVQIIGIAFNAIIVRAAQRAAEDDYNKSIASQSLPLHIISTTHDTSASRVDPKTQVHVVVTHENDGGITSHRKGSYDGERMTRDTA